MAKITMLVTSELDRDPRVQKEARLAQEAGHSVTVICRTYAGPKQPYAVRTFELGRRNSLLKKYLERARTNLRLMRYAIESRPDVVHANDLDTLAAGYGAARATGARLVYDAHELWSDMDSGRAGRYGRMAALLAERTLSRRADAVVTVSKHRAEAMARALSIEEPVVAMNTPYYVSREELRPNSWRAEFAGRHVVLYQGRYTVGMGLLEAIRAAHYLPESVALAFRGYGPLESEMRDVIAREGLGGRVTMLPPVPMNDLVKSAVGADLGLVVYEPVNLNNLYAAPNKLFEFIMAGVPCVASDLPHLREIIERGQLGDLFPPCDPRALAAAILRLLADGKRLADMRERCLAAASLYCWEVEGAHLLNVYNSLLNSNDSRIA